MRRRDRLGLGVRERVRAGGGDQHSLPGGVPRQRLPQRHELLEQLVDVLARPAAQLRLALHQLPLGRPQLSLAGDDRLDRRRELERRRVEQHQLLLDAERVLPRGNERPLGHAARPGTGRRARLPDRRLRLRHTESARPPSMAAGRRRA